MIKSSRHKGLQRFFETGSKAGIQAAHAGRLRLQLAALEQAIRPEDLSAPAWALHPLKGALKGQRISQIECEQALMQINGAQS
ncbi:type II toxin-antitoxin system RelE/ParE family toxin [Herbaspirillum sp. GW103]|uniref:type II toxin-antitoxin system RelE/ParE family toxin n=1 Tax=Herbaspirillum sp. GW103 TaxID=1175306 RepID=UPI0009D9B9E6|nr:type II toxin-antitoxin system RelE/ParE family toxin [Herbaspirillum sp. GW103]